MIGRHVRTRAGVLGAVLRDPATRAEEAGIERRAAELLDYVGIRAGRTIRREAFRTAISGAWRSPRALATDPVLLALDEPAAGMNAPETKGSERCSSASAGTARRCSSSSTTCAWS